MRESSSSTARVSRVLTPAGPAEQFDAFVSGAERDLRRLCWALTGDRGLGEDLAQTTFEKVWRHWTRIEGDPLAYARRVATNESVSWKRRRAWRAEVPHDFSNQPDAEGPAVGPVDQPDAVAADLDVERWLATLPAKHRAVIVLRYLLDCSVEETAAALGCSTGTVKSRASRALDRLRTSLAAGGRTEALRSAATTTWPAPSSLEDSDVQPE